MNSIMNVDAETIQILMNEKPMVRMLLIVAESSGSKGISTRRLLQRLGANGLHPLLTKAERLGYIRREKVKKPKGRKGNYLVVNRLTASGKQVVKTAKVLGLV